MSQDFDLPSKGVAGPARSVPALLPGSFVFHQTEVVLLEGQARLCLSLTLETVECLWPSRASRSWSRVVCVLGGPSESTAMGPTCYGPHLAQGLGQRQHLALPLHFLLPAPTALPVPCFVERLSFRQRWGHYSVPSKSTGPEFHWCLSPHCGAPQRLRCEPGNASRGVAPTAAQLRNYPETHPCLRQEPSTPAGMCSLAGGGGQDHPESF